MPAHVLLHICCGPCAIYPLRKLKSQGYEVTALFFNPNIHPLKEYLLRAEAAETVTEAEQVRLIRLDKEYNPTDYLRTTVYREEQRCLLCYQRRMERTRNIACKGGFDYFSTSLLFSKHQKHSLLESLGQSLNSSKCGFLYQDFRSGWRQGRSQAREMGIYMQNYCGCIYSEFERFQKELKIS
ncbi:epoxyqueuosine reductase QueH [Desulfonatronovibrio magnus]|uniref:epoxyqueuosine reductase QueH n=1 Tax=Desulfonatronovibrio magnus TaxID=698827 RepID=UPI0005EB878B|nr:epoxyqueuosine reductase QueH [Desulfonatronovibrio magnus]